MVAPSKEFWYTSKPPEIIQNVLVSLTTSNTKYKPSNETAAIKSGEFTQN